MRLLAKEIIKKLPKLSEQENSGLEAITYVKFFTPWSGWTWYTTEFDGNDIFFGLVDGFCKELGYFSLSELKSVNGPCGLKIERDIYFEPTKLRGLI